MSLLFQPIRFRGLEFRSRLFVSPMCQYSAKNGVAQPWHRVHLGSFAVGGAGLVMLEATGVVPEGRITPACLGLWNEEQVEALRPIVDFMKSQGAVTGIQLAHAGRKASHDVPWRGGALLPSDQGGWPLVGPTCEPYKAGYGNPKELSRSEISELVKSFALATERSLRAGFDVVELHFAHGYLLHQFLSPLSNRRTDEYGGSFENRLRFPLEVVKAVRSVWPSDKPLFVRVSATDWVEGGWDLPSTVALAKELKKAGVDLIDCSSGGLSPAQRIPNTPGYQVPFAETIRREANIAVGAVGLITEPAQAETILVDARADVVFMGRELLRDPHWPLRAAHVLGAEIAWPPQYERARWTL